MKVRKVNITTDREWKSYLRNNYHLFFDNYFLSYHSEFKHNINWHHLLFESDNRKKTVALVNGCEIIENDKKIHISSEGVSFGGFHNLDSLKISDFMELISTYISYLKRNKFDKGILNLPPNIYSENTTEEFEYSLLYSGFSLLRYSITNIINLENFSFDILTNPLKRSINKSNKSISIVNINNPDIGELEKFYDVLLKDRLLKGVTPTHSLEELIYLNKNINDKMVFFGAYKGDILIGVCLLFVIKQDVVLNFYMATDENYKKERVSDLILFKSIEWSKEHNFRIYDIGTSSVKNVFL